MGSHFAAAHLEVYGTQLRKPQTRQGTTGQEAHQPEEAGEPSEPLPGKPCLSLPERLETAAAARTAAAGAAALARLIAIPAEDGAIATRFKGHCCRLSATRTNHRCSLCRSRTVAGAPLVVLLCLTAILATLWGRITAFLEERLISSGEGEILPAIAARKLNISGHVGPRGDCTAQFVFCAQTIL